MKLKNNNQTNFHFVISFLIIISSIYALGHNFIVAANAMEKIDLLGYFTIQSNIFVLIVVILTQSGKNISRKIELAVCVNILVTAIIYQLFLNTGTYSNLFKFLARHINHGSTAVLYFIWFILKERKSSLSYKDVWVVIPFPIAYAIFAVIEGSIRGKFRYFFIDLPKLGITGFIFWICAVTILFVLLGLASILVSRKSNNINT